MKTRALFVNLGIVAMAATQLWCGGDDDAAPPPSEDGGSESGSPDSGVPDSAPDTGDPLCTAAFCRVVLPDIGAVALAGIWAKSASDVWLVGSTGFAAHFDGNGWRRLETRTKAAILSITGADDGTVWGGSSGFAFLQLNREKDGAVETLDGGFVAAIEGLSAIGPEIYAVGQMGDRHMFPPPQPDFIWRYGANPEAGAPSWSPISPDCPKVGEYGYDCPLFHALWVESARRQWFAGDNGKIYSTDTRPADDDAGAPGRIRLVEHNSRSLRRLNGIWGFAGNDVWAVGQQGTIRHWTGDAWQIVPPIVTSDLYGIWGSAPDDLWVVGDSATILHWNGTAWTIEKAPFPQGQGPRLYAVRGAGDDLWIAGESALLRAAKSGGDR